MKHYKYPSIEQFRHLIKEINYHFNTPPTLKFKGSVKVHGTNAGIVINPDGSFYCLSRNNVITVENDNCGFAKWCNDRHFLFKPLRDDLISYYRDYHNLPIILYGEFAGQGIQKGIGVSQFDRFFYIFGIKIIEEEKETWLKNIPSFRDDRLSIFSKNILSPIYEIEIDFNNPGLIQNKLIELTNEVEKECPVAKSLSEIYDKELENTIGEGIVWEYIDENGNLFNMKVKGQKHSSSKVKKLAEIDVEKLNSINEFIEYAVTENRLQQFYKEICNEEADMKFLGNFIKAISSDVNKEESDVLKESGLTMKDIGKQLSVKARNWFINKFDTQLGI